jgi:hypothetical protein
MTIISAKDATGAKPPNMSLFEYIDQLKYDAEMLRIFCDYSKLKSAIVAIRIDWLDRLSC